ncbi:MAG: ribonuclease P protein component [Streptosporangiaceae bacterium]|nr:ribonuclease P protein component [Streptosporangiaceae bacterium]
MLPRRSRMKRPEDFRLAVRAGSRAGRPTLTVHLLLPGMTRPAQGTNGTDRVRSGEPAKVGFIVSRAVGSAVVRNRVKRRMRDLMRGYVGSLPGGCLLVVRANPAAATARQADLAADLDLVIRRLLRRQVGALRQE